VTIPTGEMIGQHPDGCVYAAVVHMSVGVARLLPQRQFKVGCDADVVACGHAHVRISCVVIRITSARAVVGMPRPVATPGTGLRNQSRSYRSAPTIRRCVRGTFFSDGIFALMDANIQ